MNVKIINLAQTDSTSRYLSDYISAQNEDITIVTAKYQTAGQGMGTNTWESEVGQNLLFSVLVHPVDLPVSRQFLLSMAHALALKEALDTYTSGIKIKWPNDIYWHDYKISGTRIDTKLASGRIKNCIIGTGINVNQREFHGDAPNPLSLCKILGREFSVGELLDKVIASFTKYYEMLVNGDYINIAAAYHKGLYRACGFYIYKDKNGEFEAEIVTVEDDGHLILRDKSNKIRMYAFKEVEFKI